MTRESDEISRELGIDKASLRGIEQGMKELLGECTRVLVFDAKLRTVASTFPVEKAELRALSELMNDRDDAIRKGIVFGGKKYEVHRHHPPLVYGRSCDSEPEQSEGAVVVKIDKGVNGGSLWAAASYGMPFVSARMVPLLQEFGRKYLAKE